MHSSLPSGALPPLLASSLHVPQIPRELVLRELLLEKLDRAVIGPLTLVSAPPGFGKTTLLSQWIASRQGQSRPGLFAWVSLEDEVDLLQFWRYVTAALEGARAGLGRAAMEMLEAEQPAINTILRTVLNEIAAAQDDTILILDDYHHAEDPADFARAFVDGRIYEGLDHAEALRRVHCPVLILHANWFRHPRYGLVGAMDDADAARIQALVPQAQYKKIAANHVIHVFAPEQFVREVRAFAARLA